MRISKRLKLPLIYTLIFLASFAPAAVFNGDAVIGPFDTNYDGADIIVTNCTVTIDGTHAFASLRVQNGASLTHSTITNSILDNFASVANEQHVMAATNSVILAHTNVLLSTVVLHDPTGSMTYALDVDYTLSTLDSGAVSIQRLEPSAILDGSPVSVNYTFANPIRAGLSLMVAGDFVVEAGGTIDVSAKGFAGAAGPGAGGSSGSPASGAGGGYGGFGGMSFSNALGGTSYGDPLQPADPGSGGGSSYAGPGAPGGGSIRLTIAGKLQMDGRVLADGASAAKERAGGGSGGSIWITAQTFGGSGIISAKGGAGEPLSGGGGGGGRIAIYYDTNLYSGQIQAYGGRGAFCGGAGTVYTKASPGSGLIVCDNAGQLGTNTCLNPLLPVDLSVENGAVVSVLTPLILSNLFVEATAGVQVFSGAEINVSGDMVVRHGGSVSADGNGYRSGTGPGAGGSQSYPYQVGAGGGHGGFGATSVVGGAAPGASYGLALQPQQPGSGGGASSSVTYLQGGAGGGVIKLSVAGNLKMDGILSSDGLKATGQGSGGGAGGSVWLTAGEISGFGVISADGGLGNGYGGAGGGGRIAVYAGTNSFAGTIHAYGAGAGTNYGGPGSVYVKLAREPVGKLYLDNASRRGSSATQYIPERVNLWVRNGSMLAMPSAQQLTSLQISSNAWIVSNGFLDISENALIEAGGGIVTDGLGFQSGGPGAGRSTSVTPSGGGPQIISGGGGGYGGFGASSILGAPGGNIYETASLASMQGSSGGSGGSPAFSYPGGAGGGWIRLSVSNSLTLNGTISADGANATNGNAGGGSGGSVTIIARSFEGTGNVSGNGGSGQGFGGGGGGGRIVLLAPTNSFAGQVTAYGGASNTNAGGAGTIFMKPDLSTTGPGWVTLTLNNGGAIGTNSAINGSLGNSFHLILRGGAKVSQDYYFSLQSLFIGSNSVLYIPSQPGVLTVWSNAIIEAGGSINADGLGYTSGQGYGAGRAYSSGSIFAAGGGGHGGYGGNGALTAASGGIWNDTATIPNLPGSPGGSGGGTNFGGAGGGLINIRVEGALTVDGKISADGKSGFNQNSGGGSGGTVRLVAGSLFGTGTISANGAPGSGYCGGGGGGCLSITLLSRGTDSFVGKITAYGAAGYNAGGAGWIYRVSSQNLGVFIVDNGGLRGTNTVISGSSSTSDLRISGGAVYEHSARSILSFRDVLISNAASIVLSAQNQLSATRTVIVEEECSINADYMGYPPAQGPGAGRSSYYAGDLRGGGGYGGVGGANLQSYGRSYGSFRSPYERGSGGGNGGNGSTQPLGGSGGGTLRINLGSTGTLTLNGRISADGGPGNSDSGGGAGGSIWITAATIKGTGVVSASGGRGNGLGGGGGGGRVQVDFRTNLLQGPIMARGGAGYVPGGAGTVFLSPLAYGGTPELVVDNGGAAGPITTLGTSGTLGSGLTLKNGASVSASGSLGVNSLTLYSGSQLWFSNGLTLTVQNHATIQPGAALIADGSGYSGMTGPGAGGTGSSVYGTTGGGGGHAGFGGPSTAGSPGGITYDLPTNPLMSGSGGGFGVGSGTLAAGGPGGGVIILDVGGTLQNDGRISAEGLTGPGQGSGGGAGGGIRMTVTTLAGTGVISVNGGDGNGLGGGGGGGRILVAYLTNLFTGEISAYGGKSAGVASGGAGTIWIPQLSNPGGRLIVDNGGTVGTNTPIVVSWPIDLSIARGAMATAGFLTVSNLTLENGAGLILPPNQGKLEIVVLDNASISTNAFVSVNGRGFPQGAGPGAGASTNGIGSGAGHGGRGGASSLLPGGESYGSAEQPVEPGSGGGTGFGGTRSGSEGGGSLRLSVGGTLNIDGVVSANGEPGLQDDAGGGAGGSILVSANALHGTGAIQANGGDGELSEGGGGGGGRIAIYARTNDFKGEATAFGGGGWFSGLDGSIFLSTNLEAPVIVAHAPVGAVSNQVSFVDLTFTSPPFRFAVNYSRFTLLTPLGPIATTDLTVSSPDAVTLRFGFPSKTAVGEYTVFVEPGLVSDIFGQPLSASYTGKFTISLPLIQGIITNIHGDPIAGVEVRPSLGSPAVTDTNGLYSIGAPPGISFSISPILGTRAFVPGARTYTDVTNSLSGQDFLAVESLYPVINAQRIESNLVVKWFGIPGVRYQWFSSSNLLDWVSYSNVIIGTNGPMQTVMPMGSNPAEFYKLGASN